MNNQNFYLLHCNGTHPIASLKKERDPRSIAPWTSGEPLTHPPVKPLLFTVDLSWFSQCDEDLEDEDLLGYTPADLTIAAYKESLTPALMHKDLLAVILSVGDITIEQFPVEIFNEFTGETNHDFRAINLIGVAEVEVSRDLNHIPQRRQFKLPIASYLMFHLYEDGPIVVHETVKRAIENAGFSEMNFTPTYEEY